MEPDEVRAICAEVLANRKRGKAPMVDPLPLTFRNFRKIRDAGVLAPGELRQLVAVGQDGVGMALPPEEVLGEDAADEGLYDPEAWDVIDAAGALAYRVWMYGVDNGTVFRADTIEIVAGCSQGGLESMDGALVAELKAARARAVAEGTPEGSFLRFLGR